MIGPPRRPPAGAEATGVAHARGPLRRDLESDVCHRAVPARAVRRRPGAVPTAIAAADHHRLMCSMTVPMSSRTVPRRCRGAGHAAGDWLASAMRRGSRTNPERWAKIYSASHEALGTQIDDPRAGGGGAGAARRGDGAASRRGRRWCPGSAARCCGSAWWVPTRERCSSHRRRAQPAGVVVEIAPRWGRAGVNSPTCRWRPRPTTGRA